MSEFLSEEIRVQESQRQIVKGAFWTYLGQGIVVLATLLSNVILARLLDKANWGVFSLVISLFSFISAFSDIGFNYTIQNRLASSRDRSVKAMRDVLSPLIRYKSIVITFLTLILLCCTFSGFFSGVFNVSNGTNYFIAGVLFFLFFSISGTFDSVFIGLKQFKNFSITGSTFQIVRLILSVLFVIIGFEVIGALSGYVIALIVSVAVQVYLLRNYLFIAGKASESLTVQLKYGLNVGIASMAYVIFFNSGAIMLGLLINPTEVGFYRIASGIAASAIGAVFVINKVMFSFFSSESDAKHSIIQLKKALRYAAIFAIPACIGLAVSSEVIVGVFFGSQYLPSALALSVLSYFVFDAVYGGIFVSYLAAKEKSGILGKVAITAIFLNFLLSWTLIQLIGSIGAAVSSAFLSLSALIFLYFWAKKKTNITLDLSNFKQPILSSFIMFLVLILMKQYLWNQIFVSDLLINFLRLCVFIATGVVAYFVSAYFLGFEVHTFLRKVYAILRSRQNS